MAYLIKRVEGRRSEGKTGLLRTGQAAHRQLSTALAPGRRRDVGPPSFLERPPRRGEAARLRDLGRRRAGLWATGSGRVVWLEDWLSGTWGGEPPGGTRGRRRRGWGWRPAVKVHGSGGRQGRSAPPGVRVRGRECWLRPGLEAAPGAGGLAGRGSGPRCGEECSWKRFAAPGRELGVMASLLYPFSQLCKQSVLIRDN